MRALLDAHAILWFIWGHGNLSAKAQAIMADGSNDLLLSAGTLWEIAIKVGLGKLQIAEPYEVFMDKAILDNDLSVLPISVKHAATLSTLPLHHRDPFDRLLVAQAMVEQIPIVSGDPALDAYPVARLW
ncbi:MAG TPA: type II toxin-antitoxin system VapC family toxin [Thermoguttaceae bacterium]|nr:type II toxin-antitoxin system VapC family toxin [Thermoguttaceae bacterium]